MPPSHSATPWRSDRWLAADQPMAGREESMPECDAPGEVAAMTAELVARKAVTRDVGAGPLPELIARFAGEEFDAARVAFAGGAVRVGEEAQAEVDAIFCGG